MSWKPTLLNAVLGGALLLGGALVAQAHQWDSRCFEKVRREEFKLQRDIARHGLFSPQAEHRRQKISALRERCLLGRQHTWWRDGDRSWGRRHHRHRWHDRNADDDRDDRWQRRDGDADDSRDERWERRDRDDRWHHHRGRHR